MRCWWKRGLLAAMLTFASSSMARADDEPKVEWRPEWRKFQPWEYVVTGTTGVGIGAIILFTHEREPAWHGGFFLDDPVRDNLRAQTDEGRRHAQYTGDAFYYGGLAFPYLVDVIGVAWLGHGKPEVAGQMALIDTEAFAVTGFLSFVSNALIRRERPYVRECTEQSEQRFPPCDRAGQSESFFSGHTAIAATAAGLTCAHHANLPLYGGGIGDALACVGTIGGALATGYTRMVADKHYLLDVVTGVAIGFPVGWFFAAHHYRAKPASSTARSWTMHAMPTLSSTSIGLAALGRF